MSEKEVRAAGGVVVHNGQIALVHRPHYDDWSLPKGKLDPGEGWRDAALREVREETGLDCELGAELDPVTYRDHRDRPKRVRYWVMTVKGRPKPFKPNDECDELRWLEPKAAIKLLTYERDKDLARSALESGLPA